MNKHILKFKAGDFLIGTLSGGMVNVLQVGAYGITISVADALGTTFSATKTLLIKKSIETPPQPVFTMPEVSCNSLD